MADNLSPERCKILMEISEIDEELERRWDEISTLQKQRLRIVEKRQRAVLRHREVVDRERAAESGGRAFGT